MSKVFIHPLLTHQPKEEFYKCISINLFGTKVYFCSRCLGYHLVFLPSMICHFLVNPQFSIVTSLAIIFVLPMFTFVDWGLTKFNITKSHNGVRFISATLFGFGAFHAIYLFIIDHLRLYIVLFVVFYATITLIAKYFVNRLE